MARQYELICIQETHGTVTEIEKILAPLASDFHILANPHPNRNCGGTVTLIAHSVIAEGSRADIHKFATIPGRAQLLGIQGTHNRSLCVVNIHNYDISPAEGTAFASDVDEILEQVLDSPVDLQLIAAGDFNDLPPGERSVPVASAPGRGVGVAVVRDSSPCDDICARMIDLAPDACTHYNPATSLQQRLDRIYVAVQPWCIDQLQVDARMHAQPLEIYAKGLSDMPQSASSSQQGPRTAKSVAPCLGGWRPTCASLGTTSS